MKNAFRHKTLESYPIDFKFGRNIFWWKSDAVMAYDATWRHFAVNDGEYNIIRKLAVKSNQKLH